MSIFNEMSERDEGRIEGFSGGDAAFLVDRQHALEQIDKFPSIRLFPHQFWTLQIRGNVDLPMKNDEIA